MVRAGLIVAGGSYIGGWGLNNYYEGINTPENIPESNLKSEPYFKKGDDDTIYGFKDLFDPEKTASASSPLTHAALLATFVPAKRLALGAIASVEGITAGRQFEMQHDFYNGGWYDNTNISAPDAEYWDHGDFKIAAMPFVCRLYERFVEIGGLDDE